jgi:hypothetical protein
MTQRLLNYPPELDYKTLHTAHAVYLHFFFVLTMDSFIFQTSIGRLVSIMKTKNTFAEA